MDLGDRCRADRLLVESRENSVSSGASSACSIARLIAGNGSGGSESWSCSRFAAANSPTRSGRVDSAWPSLIAAGPISCSAAA